MKPSGPLAFATRLILVLSGIAPAFSAVVPPLSSEQSAFFESKIRPALTKYCYECHSSGEKVRGGLLVDSRDGLLQGGDTGPAIVPGDPAASLLFTAISWQDRDTQMPPKNQMPAEVIADFRSWIAMGAPDPRVNAAVTVKTTVDLDAGRQFWAFQKPKATPAPEPKLTAWANTEVDRFVLASMESKNLHPLAAASPEALVRRLHFDLTGLPPSPEEVLTFVRAWKVDPERAMVAKTDALLASPHFGERWGRHWLDVARYAESTGKELNLLYTQAWRYRDYVIDSFNKDKPFDRFIMEQVAGDLLPIRNDQEFQENLIATGFLAIGTKGLNVQDSRQFAMDVADEQIDTTFQAFQALTVACARCHDHKTDPIPTTDYYALAGIFLSTQTYYGTVPLGINRRNTELLILPVQDATPLKTYSPQEIAGIKQRLADAQEQLTQVRADEFRQRTTGAKGANNINSLIRLRSQIGILESILNGLDEQGRTKSFAMGVQERNELVEAAVLVRGDVDKPAQKVPRGLVQVLQSPGESHPVLASTSGRMELARCLASADNPLTARVMVNRIWQYLFGRGLVPSADNFGKTGQPPSHPELLDYLALRFVANGWSVKSMIRELVLTKTYRMSTALDAGNFAIDPDNIYLWRSAPRRLDAESVRDAMLVASGELERNRPRSSTVNQMGDAALQLRANPDIVNRPEKYRSVYLPSIRDQMPEALALFDGADPNMVSGVREATNVPGQALYLMNNPVVVQRAEAMAARLGAEAATPRDRFQRAFLLCYGRPPTEAEIESCQAFFKRFVDEAQKSMDIEKARNLAFTSFCQGLFASAEFRFLN